MHLYYSIWIVFTCIICMSLSASKIPVFIGVMMSRNNSAVAADVGYQTSASAVYLAVDRAKNESLINRFDLRIEFVFDDCNEAYSAGLAAQLMADNVTAIIGPSCNDGALAAGSLSTFYNIPIITWGDVTNSAISDVVRFPATITVAPMSQSIAIALLQLLQQFDWNQFVYFYGNTDFCNNLQSDINNQSYLYPDLTLVRSIQLLDYSTSRIVTNLQKIPSLGRVIVMCFADDLTYVKRSVALALLDQGMLSTEYVILFVDNTVSFTIVTPTVTGDKVVNLWEDNSTTPDGRDADAFLAFQQIFSMRTAVPVNNASTQFQQQVIEDMSKPPLNCIQECAGPQYQTAATYANQLFDAMYMYLRALNKTIQQKQNIRDGATIILNTAGTFEGQSGTVVMNDVGVRCPILFVLSLDNNENTNVMANLSVDQFTANYTQVVPLSVMWKRYGGHPPPAIPVCGLMNENCPVSFFVAYLWIVIIGAVLLVIITVTTLGSGFCYLRAKKEEEDRLNELWQIPTVALIKPGHKKKLESERSLQSGPSTTSTRITENSMNETAKFAYYLFEKEPVAAEKHGFHPRLTKSDTADLRHMCELDHENLNRFIGLCIDGPICLSVWRYCSRGSIKKVLEKGTLSLDGFFIYSIMSDIANGLAFIHKSILGCHGYLTSSCCFINDRWQIKIGGYGLKFLREKEKREEKQLLYTAPEILRGDDEHLKSKEADIYSFAIICSELITRKGVWNMNNRKEEPDEIIFMVKRGGRHVVRPDLDIPSDTDINPALLLLTRECWDEEPARRPKIEFIRNSLKRLQNGRNLMDHVFNVLEKYASTLEEEVEDRMKELVEEKKKSDILLYRMLPQQVAEKLKLGQSVQPESFDSVTIFFSDVVSFTKLASKCTPLQVVNLLNDLYTTFDAIIDDHDAYKVETIGDGYLCVSGLPRRNGNEHIREICSMALALLRSLKSFRISHLPKERINIRVGIHTGSCVAGVVGLTMPRYCLFGDSVNTASRMESNGKPGRIHLSPESHSLLVKMYPQYKTESRGEVIIKGKGVMETFWLLNDDGELSDDEEKNPNK